MILDAFVVGRLQANCYAVGDEESREVLIVDPGDQGEALVEAFRTRDYRVTGVVVTHHHLDHSGGAHEVLQALPDARFYMHAADYPQIAASAPSGPAWYGREVAPPRAPDQLLEHGDVLRAGRHEFQVLHCPGHTPGHVCMEGEGVVFTGDVLFQGSIGRHDFPGSDGPALIRSIRDHLLTLPDETAVYSGHGPATTIGEERRHNPFLVNPRMTLGFDVD
ncbi:MAG: MBL fold metallo-hydrolase [Dehalococcoidia bacterium]|nr:MBL fold metallo-hydrolase [Dehalococcoidia bacterium]